jgi:uncharacterized protein YggE
MRKKSIFLLVILALAALLSACASNALAQTDEGSQEPQKRTISVNGSGRVTLSPDLARISIGVQTDGEDAAEAVAENNSQAQAVQDALDGFAIAAEDIRTTNFSIYPRQDYGPEGEIRSITYVVNNTVFVTVRDLDQIGEILEAVVSAGANNINSIQFDVADREGANQEALKAAVANARERAEALAEAAEVELGAVQSIESFLGNGPVPVVREFAAVDMEAIGGAVPVSPGEMEITVEVGVVFEIQ